MRKSVMAVVVAVVIIAASSCDVRSAVEGTVCVLGDSNTGTEELNLVLGAGERPYYPVIRKIPGLGLVHDILDDEGGLRAGWSSNPVDSHMARTGRECLRLGGSVVVIALGMNDAEWAEEQGADRYRSDVVAPVLESFEAVNPDVRVLWLLPPSVPDHRTMPGVAEVRTAVLAEVAVRPSLVVLDFDHFRSEIARVCADPAEGCEVAADPTIHLEPGDHHLTAAGRVTASILIRLALDCRIADDGWMSGPERCGVVDGDELGSLQPFMALLPL